MAFRIYTLAKELQLDSKVLVDICTRAGIPGKGSALASLTEEEVTQLKAYLAKGAAKSAPSKTAVMEPPPRREDFAPAGKPPVLSGKPPVMAGKSRPLSAKLAPEPAAPPEPTPEVEAPPPRARRASCAS